MSRKVTVVVPELPPSLNRFAGRKNVWEYRKLKQAWKDKICMLAEFPLPPFKRATVTITYYFPDRIRRDPDNFSGKMILDGLTAAGIIVDDSFFCVELHLVGRYDKWNPRTEIEVIENEQD